MLAQHAETKQGVPVSDQTDTPQLHRLLQIITRLRAPGGCPWDREQTEVSMAPHLLEEAYEAIEALQSGDRDASCEELGDVLMNVLMIAQIAGEDRRYDSEDVARGIADKLVRRHPHVFGDAAAGTADEVLTNWERIKKAEKGDAPRAALAGVPANLPALLQAFRIGEKASRAGFDWPDRDGPRRKIDEELKELDEAVAAGDPAAIESELGDVLFSLVNLARHAGVNPEMALRGTNGRFRHRFGRVEAELGGRLGEATIEEMEAIWQAAKQE
jgi:nucleoside triphosphate diphosphatase